MGWAKYAEDDYEIFLERQSLRGEYEKREVQDFVSAKTEKINAPKENNGIQKGFGNRCFSL